MRCCCRFLVSMMLCSCIVLPAGGVVREWDDEGATSDWSEAANWTDDTVPETTDDAIIGSLADAFDDSVVLDVNGDLVRTLGLQNGADFDTNGGRLVMTVTGSVGEGAASGATISELIVRKRNAIGEAAFAIDANSLAIGANGQLALPDGGQVELDGTGPQPGVLSVADGGTVRGYGWIELSDTDASLGQVTNLLDNSGAIVVEDPLFTGPGEPTSISLEISASNAPTFAQLDFAGTSATGTVELSRNASLMVGPVFSGPSELTMAANTQLVMQSAGTIASGQMIEVNSGVLNSGEENELPALPAVITGDGLLTTSGTIRLNTVSEELIIETPIDALEGEITNRGTLRFRGGGNIRAVSIDDLDLGTVINESSEVLQFQGGQAYESAVSNDGLLGIEPAEENATVDFDSFAQSAAGALAIDVGGELAGEFDVLSVVGDATLEGTLQVTLTDLFEPELGSMFTILSSQSGAVSGVFATTDFPQFGGRTFDVIYNPTSVELEVIEAGSLAGDFDFDGDVDGTDYLLWQRGESPDPLSAEDFADWQGNYGTNPPGLASATAVPEPSSLLIVAFSLVAAAVHRPISVR